MLQKKMTNRLKELDRLIRLSEDNIISIRELKESQKNTEAFFDKVGKRIEKIGKLNGNLSNNVGSIAENFFFSAKKIALESGIFVLGQAGKNIQILNGENFKPKILTV